jgi:hypothetical protein
MCGARVTIAAGRELPGACVLPIHHSFFHLWVDPRGYTFHWNGPDRQVMGEPTVRERIRLIVYPPGWLESEVAVPATAAANSRS